MSYIILFPDDTAPYKKVEIHSNIKQMLARAIVPGCCLLICLSVFYHKDLLVVLLVVLLR
jgi:hypothetical protein